MKNKLKKLISALKKLDIIYKEPVVLTSGIESEYYVDVKKAYGYPKNLHLVAENVYSIMDKRVTCVATSGLGGFSLGTALEIKYDINHCMIRDNPKKHGKGGIFEGHAPEKNDRVVILDDVLTTGKSLNNAVQAVKPTDAEIIECIAVVKRGDLDFEKYPDLKKYTIKWVLTVDELL